MGSPVNPYTSGEGSCDSGVQGCAATKALERIRGNVGMSIIAAPDEIPLIYRALAAPCECEWLREKLGVADGKIAALVAVLEESHAERDQLREKLKTAAAALQEYVDHFGDPLKVARPALENIRR